MTKGACSLINAILSKVGRELGMPAVELDANGEVGLTAEVEGREVSVTISYREAEELVFFCSPVGLLPPGEIGAQFHRVLSALNLSPADTGGLSFAVSPDQTVLLVGSVFGPEYQLSSFRTVLTRLFVATAAWQERLEQARTEKVAR
jgi:hypothetical protein